MQRLGKALARFRRIDVGSRTRVGVPRIMPAIRRPPDIVSSIANRRIVDHPATAVVHARMHRHISSHRLDRARTDLTAMMRFDEVVTREPDILEGTPVFLGTRVPIRSLFDYLEGGETLDEFLRQFPSVRRAQAVALLDLARRSVLADARAA
jgi:uncharacterized protein (DUF433 family)